MDKIIILMFLTSVIMGMALGMHGPILPIFAQNTIGADYNDLGIIGTVMYIPYMLLPLLIGPFLDRFNNSLLLSLGAFISVASIWLLAISSTVTEIIILRILLGVSFALLWPPCEALISRYSNRENRVRNISWFLMFFVIGFMIGPPIGSVLLEIGSTYEELFQYTGMLSIIALVAALWAAKKENESKKEKYVITESAGKTSITSILEMGKFPHVIIIMLFCTSALGIVLAIYPAYLDNKNITDVDVLMIFFIMSVSRVAWMAVANKTASRSKLTLIMAVLLLTVGFGMSAYTVQFEVFLVAAVLMGFGFAIIFPLSLEIMLSKTPKNISGSIIGVHEAIFGAGWIIGPVLAGLAAQSFGDQVPFIALFIIGLSIALAAVFSRDNLKIKRWENCHD